MSLPDREKEILFNEIGNLSGTLYKGVFKVKRILTKREQFEADLNRRTVLGPAPDEATVPVVNDAYALGQLSVRVISGPEWWNPHKETVGGLDLPDGDTNVIGSLFAEVLKAEDEYRKEVQQKAEDKEKVVKKTAAKKNESLPDEE